MAGSSNAEEGAPNLTPLLDVVLQLIMFFMITVNFVRVDQISEEIILPKAENATEMTKVDKEDAYVFINLNEEGKLVGVINPEKKELSIAEIKVRLQKRKNRILAEAKEAGRKKPTVWVVLRAHKDAEYIMVYNMLDTCARAGFTNWQIRVEMIPLDKTKKA